MFFDPTVLKILFFGLSSIGVLVCLLKWFLESSVSDDNENIRMARAKKHKEAVWIANYAFVRVNKWNLVLICVIFVASVVLALSPTMPVVDRDLTTLEAFKGGDASEVDPIEYDKRGAGPLTVGASLITPIDY